LSHSTQQLKGSPKIVSKTTCSYRNVVCSIFAGNSTKYVEIENFQPHDMLELKGINTV